MAVPGYRRLNPRNQNKDFIWFVIAIAIGVLFLLLSPIYFLKSGRHAHAHPKQTGGDDVNNHGDDIPPPPLLIDPANFSDEPNMWLPGSLSSLFHGCSNASSNFSRPTINTRFLTISLVGGLNRQRLGIADAVVAARILNATLIVPKLSYRSYFWNDSSTFTELFNVKRFISSLVNDVRILQEIPLIKRRVVDTRVPRHCTPTCYYKRVLPLLHKEQVLHFTKFDSGLANILDDDLQKLRCRVNYEALRFADPILHMGRQLVKKLRTISTHYIALDLRFDAYFLALSGCNYGGEKEKRMEEIRRQWSISNTTDSHCPLTPEEVGLMLRALGFERDTHIYLGSGEVYGGEETLGPLKDLFPNLHSKETLTSKGELSAFYEFPLRMAAIDFRVYDKSNVFVTNNNGYTAKVLAGRRRYFGHKRTILPNWKILSSLFKNRHQMSWKSFAAGVRTQQRDYMGDPYVVRSGRGGFYENPAACICTVKDATIQGENFEDDETDEKSYEDDETDEMLSD